MKGVGILSPVTFCSRELEETKTRTLDVGVQSKTRPVSYPNTKKSQNEVGESLRGSPFEQRDSRQSAKRKRCRSCEQKVRELTNGRSDGPGDVV